MKRPALDQLARDQRLGVPAIAAALEISGALPDAAAWRAFTVRVLEAAGIAALGAGAIFFVAANWQDYGLIGRFAILQAGLAACVGLALWRPPPAALGQGAIVLAILLTGALLALFGQSYQTGADVYELFFTWFVLALPFTVAGRSGAAWATGWTVLNVAMALYCGLAETSFARWLWTSRFGIDRPLLLFFACLIDLGGAALFMHLALPRWLARVAATYGFLFGTIACIVVIIDSNRHSGEGIFLQDAAVMLAFAAACGAIGWWSLRQRNDVFAMALMCASWIAITAAALVHFMPLRDLGAFFVIALWLIGTSTAAGFVLMKWVREWRATE